MFQNIQSSSPKSAAANLESSQSPRPADFDASSAVFLPLSPSMLRTNQKLSDKSRPATASAATQNINNNEPQRGNNTNPFIIDMYSLPNFFGFPSTIGMMKQEHPLEAASGDLRSTTPSPLPPPQQANKPKGSSQGKSNDERKRQQVVEYGIIDDKKNDKDDGILLAASPLSSTPVSPLEMKRDKRKARAKSAGPNSSSESATLSIFRPRKPPPSDSVSYIDQSPNMRFKSPDILAKSSEIILPRPKSPAYSNNICKSPQSASTVTSGSRVAAAIMPHFTLSSDSRRTTETSIFIPSADSTSRASIVASNSPQLLSHHSHATNASSLIQEDYEYKSSDLELSSSADLSPLETSFNTSNRSMSRRRSSTAPSRFGSGSSVNQRKFPVVDRDGADNITDAIGQRELDRLLKKALGTGESSKRASMVFRKANKRGSTAAQLLLKTGIDTRTEQGRDVADIVNDIINPQAEVVLTETQIHERAQYHWKLAWGNVIRGIRSTSMFASYRRNRKSEGKSIPIVKSSAFSEQAFRHLLKSFQTRADLVLNTKIKIVLSDSPQNRKHEDMVALEKILTPKIRAFARFTLPQRIAILKRIRYSAFPTGATVLKEGHLPFCFYIIISGQVDVLKNQTDRILRLSILNRGDSFGDVGLQGVLASRRTASIVVSADAEFLVLDKDDYIEILFGENAGAEIKQRLEMVKSIPLFRDNAMHETVLHQLVMKTETRVFENGGVSILEENEVNKYLFFIVSGSVSLRKTVNYKTKSKSTASITSQATSVSSEKSLKTDLEDGLNGSSLVAIETTQQSTETSFQLLQEINQSATGDFLNDSSYLVSSNRRASATQIITSASEKSHSFLNLSARYPIARALSTSRLPDNPYENASVSQTLIEQALLSTTEGESSSRRNSLAKKYVDASRKGCFNSNLALVDKNSNTCIQLDDDSFSVSATTVPTTMADSTVDIGVLSKFKMDFQQIANGKNVDDGNNYSDLHKSKVRLPEKSADADSKSPGATRRPKSAITFEFANEQKKHKSPSSSARQSRHRVKSALTSRPSSSSRPGSPFKPKRSTSSSTLRPGSANRKSNSSLHSKSDDEGGDGNSEEQSEGPVFLEIAVLTQGSSFPEIAKPTMFPPESVCLMLKDYSSGAHKLPEDHLNETVDQEIKHRLGEAGYEYPSYTTALTEGPVKCLTISRLEFLRIAPPIMVRMMFELLFECYIPLEELEEELEEKMLWVRYRKDVARQIRIEKNKIKQLEKDRSVSC